MRIKLYRGQFYAVWREGGKTRRTSLRTDDRAVAERRLLDQQKKPTGQTVAELVQDYLRLKEDAPSHPSMLVCWQNLKSHFAHLRADQITPDLCKKYKKARKVSDGTVIKDLGFLRTAVKGRGANFWLPPTPLPRDRYLTRPEFDRLLKASTLPHIRLFMILALTTGGRAGAILGLTWDRVDFTRGIITLADGRSVGKGRSSPPMTPQAREALEEARKGAMSNWVIEWGGKQVKSVKRAFRQACADAGLKGVTPHVLRHTAAVWMIEAGRSITEVAQYLGHSDTRTTFRVYARHSPDHLREAAKALEF